MKMKNGKVELQLPDCNRVYELGEAKSGCVPSGITNATQRGGVIYDIETGNVESAVVKLNRTWTSLPEGPEKKINREDAKRIFKECISKELTDKSSIAIPKGELIL